MHFTYQIFDLNSAVVKTKKSLAHTEASELMHASSQGNNSIKLTYYDETKKRATIQSN